MGKSYFRVYGRRLNVTTITLTLSARIMNPLVKTRQGLFNRVRVSPEQGDR